MMEDEKERPNIRIEILNEKMEVDESENEDGEIRDEEPIQVLQNARTVFTTGINIFDHEEQKKLQERAKRFDLKPEEIHSFTDADLEELRQSLGITEENENIVRFDTLHLLGTKNMMIEDILEYFAKYAPIEVEFVDEQSVNIKWLENITAARAIFYSSKAVIGMPAREQVLVNDFLDTDQPEEKVDCQSILLKNRQVEFQIEEVVGQPKKSFKNSVNIEEITIPIPPGYWRMGDKHPKAKCILLRFAFKTDKKPYKIESLAKYYKKLNNSKAQSEKKKEGIFERNRDLPRGKNPWGNLARNWDQDVKFREATPTSGETVEIKNANLATRLGVKAPSESENEVEVVETRTTVKKPKGRSMRMRMYADEEEERLKIKKAIQKLKKSTEKLTQEPKDLRAILTLNNNVTEPIEIIDLVQEDLGNRLKNRSRQMVYSLERDPNEINNLDRKENIRSDIRTLLNRKRARSPYEERHIEERSHRYRARSPLKRNESPVHRRRSPIHRRRTPERTVRYRQFPRFKHQSDDSENEGHLNGVKPRSKVAVVIKTQKKPAVASTVWSKVHDRSNSEESSSESDEGSSKSEESGSSSSSDSSEDSDSDSESGSSESSEEEARQVHRPGFGGYNSRVGQRNPLKITMENDRYSRR